MTAPRGDPRARVAARLAREQRQAVRPGQKAIHHVSWPASYGDGQWTYTHEERDVFVLAIAGKWAMVRRARGVPYVAPASKLTVRQRPAR